MEILEVLSNQRSNHKEQMFLTRISMCHRKIFKSIRSFLPNYGRYSFLRYLLLQVLKVLMSKSHVLDNFNDKTSLTELRINIKFPGQIPLWCRVFLFAHDCQDCLHVVTQMAIISLHSIQPHHTTCNLPRYYVTFP